MDVTVYRGLEPPEKNVMLYQARDAVLHAGQRLIQVHVGFRGTERIVPPAGEEHAFTRNLWRRDVEIYISKTGRSVRVFVDGTEVK